MDGMDNWISGIRKRFYDLSIFKKINVSNMILIVPPIIIFLIFSNQIFTSIIVDKNVQSSLQNLDLINQSINGLLKQSVDLSTIAITNERIQDLVEANEASNELSKFNDNLELSTLLNNIIQSRTAVSAMLIYSKSGNLVGSSLISSKSDKLRLNQEDLRRADNQSPDALQWSDMHEIGYDISGKPVYGISLVRPMYSLKTGNKIGFVQIDVDEPLLSIVFSNMYNGHTSLYEIVNQQGIVVSTKDKGAMFSSIRDFTFFHWVLSNDRNGKVFNINGKKYLINSKKMDNFNWIIVGQVPMNELMRDSKRVTRTITMIGSISIAIAFLFSLLISRTISRPIGKLIATMNKVGKGSLDVRMNLYGRDEVGQLSVSFNKMVQEISDLMQRVVEEQNKKKEYEFTAIQAQINPHFLYNTLESVCALALMNKNDEVYKMVKALSVFYRVGLSKGRNIISIKEEIQNIKSYLVIQQIRYEGSFDTEIDIDPGIMEKQIVKLSVQPLIENAIYHGLRNKRGKGIIIVQGRQHKDIISITVSDNGCGFDVTAKEPLLADSNAEHRSGFGLRSVDERIKLYFGEDYGIRIHSKKDFGTTIEIRIPN
jgi:two-component system sensor histidine kinase YesM